MTALDFDIIVVGGGVAGAACAALLAGQHRRIALIDARRPDCAAMPEDFDLRVVALSPGSQQILDAAGAWSKIPVERLASYRKMSVHADAQGVDFRAADHGLQELGWIAEIPIVEKALWQRLASLDSVSLFAPVTWKTADLGAETVRLTLDDGRVLRAALLVAADGGRSRLRQQAEIRVDEWHYNQRALIAPVTTEQPNRDQAWQRFTEHGPLALLPLPDGRSSIVWSQAGGRAEQLAEMPADDFIAEINRHQDSPFGNISEIGARRTLPLIRRRARQLFHRRLVLIGDAARTVHPLAGQGLNLGLMDAAALAQVLQAWTNDSPEALLKIYQRWRQSNGSLIGGGIHAINELVRAPAGAGRALLSVGFGLSSRLWPLREAFVARACGLDSDSPKIARAGYSLSAPDLR